MTWNRWEGDSTQVVSREEWLQARVELLAKEKEHSRAHDELTRARQALPWVKMEKEYIFDGRDGKVSLGELFEGKSQLVIQHFMFDSDWDEGCKFCSFMADHMDRLPKGRDEAGQSYGMQWLRLKDAYDDDSYVDPYAT